MLHSTMPESSGGLKRQTKRAELVIDPADLTARCRQGLNSRVPNITKEVLGALVTAENGRDIFISTAELPCFYLRVTKDGHRSYCIQHRVTGRHTIGDVRVKPIEVVLKRARAILDAAGDGRNLLAEEKAATRQKEAEQAATVKATIDQYLAEPSIRRLRSYKEKSRYLNKVWIEIHNESAEKIQRSDVVPVLRRIASERGERTANAAKATLNAMFAFAVLHGWLKRDTLPTNHLPRWEEKSRERKLSLDELGLVWKAAPQVDEAYGRVIRLLAITGARRSEIYELARSEIDLRAAQIVLPGGKTKNRRQHIIPLPPVAVAILEEQLALPSIGQQVFAGAITWSRAKARLDKLVKLDVPWVVHDLRRSFATGTREHLGADTHLVELAINHVSGSRAGVAGAYDRSQRLAERRRLFERWAELVVRAAGEPLPDVRVVNLR